MTTIDVTSAEVQTMFKGKKVLIIGDSISRGLYKDLACLLNGNDRLLFDDELRFSRHNNEKNLLFGEVIDSFKIDRSNSRNNIEKRKCISIEHDYHLCYWFCSRIWNRSMNEFLTSIQQYDCIIMQSMIWDLSRYGDSDGKFYLQNLEICLSKMTQLNKNIIWINIPPSNCDKTRFLNNLIFKMHSSTMELLKNYNCTSLNLYDKLNNHLNVRHVDGVHFTPTGHRFITYYLIKTMPTLLEKENPINSTIELSSSNDLLEDPNIPLNEIDDSSKHNQQLHAHQQTKQFRGGYRYNNRFYLSSRHQTLYPKNDVSYINNNPSNIPGEDENPQKRTRLDNEAEHFGRAFGFAWKAYRQF